MTDESVLELVSKVDEFLELSNLIDDDDLNVALSHVVKLCMKPDVPPQTATRLIIQLQSISAKLHIAASWYKNVARPKPDTVEYKKKNMYFSVADALNDVVGALKYQIRNFNG